MRGSNHKSLLFLTTSRPEATVDSFIIAKRFTDCSPLVPSSGEIGAQSGKVIELISIFASLIIFSLSVIGTEILI